MALSQRKSLKQVEDRLIEVANMRILLLVDAMGTITHEYKF
jgi:hypothetical protein